MTMTFFLHNQLVALPGIKRALEEWPRIDFADDHDGCLFTATVRRMPVEELKLVSGSPKSSPKSSPNTEDQIIDLIRHDASVTTEAMGAALGITKRAVLKQVDKLKAQGRLRRVGPAKGGYWEVIGSKE
jgi:ATP-dependent DNA helicase RecG